MAVKPIEGILDKADVDKLMNSGPINLKALGEGVIGLHGASAGVMGAVAVAGAAGDDGLNPLERELVILGAMVASDASDALVAIHIFVALRSGATPGKIANTLLVAGGYSGVQRYVHYLTVLKKVLYLLKREMGSGLYNDGVDAGDKKFLLELAEPLLDHEYDDERGTPTVC